jgi:GTP-binding protein
LINFFLVNERIYFVDLPGYGFARAPKEVKKNWGQMIEDYLVEREPLKLAILLVDSRRPPADSDVTMKRWLDYQQIPNAIILTKADKISRTQLKQALQTSAHKLNTKEITAFSAVTALGKDEILRRVEAAID